MTPLPPTPEAPSKNLRYAWYVVAILMLIYVSSFIDRQVLTLLVGPMKRDLHLSDTQISLLMGFSFAIFYTLLGIPAGLVADRRNRRSVIGWGIAIWSLMTATGGLARTFGQFFVSRVGVGVGEAALSPAAYSIITDYFPKNKLATAISVYGAGIYIGSGLAVLIGGLLLKLSAGQPTMVLPVVGEIFSWQLIFFLVGLPGLLLVLLLQTVREPARTGLTVGAGKASFGEAIRYVRQHGRAYWLTSFATGLVALVGYGCSAWIPTFFNRTYGWPIPKISVYYGLLVAVICTIGIIGLGRVADRLMQRGYADAKLRVLVGSSLMLAVFMVIFPLMPTPELALLAMIPVNIGITGAGGPAPAAIQELMPARIRAVGSAIYLLILNLIGVGLGPTSIALVTDFVFHDEQQLRYSMAIVGSVSACLAALLYWLALRSYGASVKRAQLPDLAYS
jgi:MFS family permease